MAIANLWTCKKNVSLDYGTVIVVLVFLSVAIYFHSWMYLLRNAVQSLLKSAGISYVYIEARHERADTLLIVLVGI